MSNYCKYPKYRELCKLPKNIDYYHTLPKICIIAIKYQKMSIDRKLQEKRNVGNYCKLPKNG